MRTEKQAKDEVGTIGMLLILGWLLFIAFFNTGCAGVELGGRLGVYRVDERADSSATVQAQTKPWKCYFVNCESGAHGS